MQPVRVEALDELRHQVAQIEAIAPTLADAEPSVRLGVAAIDTALGGGLPLAAVHELAPALPIHSGAAQGFAVALAALTRGSVLWVETDFARMENGAPYGPGLALSGLALERLVLLTVPRSIDVLWAMEEALRSRAVTTVIAEVPDDRTLDDGPATRRLSLAAREAGGFGLLLRQRPSPAAKRGGDPLANCGSARRTGCVRRPRPHHLRPLAHQEPARPLRPVDSSPGITMNASSTRRYLSVWLRRLATDRIARRSSAPADAAARHCCFDQVGAAHHGAERRRGAPRAQGRHGARRRARHVSRRLPVERRRSGRRPALAGSDRRLVRPLHAAGRARCRPTVLRSTSPAARICSAARRRSAAIWSRGSRAQGFAGPRRGRRHGRLRLGRGALSAKLKYAWCRRPRCAQRSRRCRSRRCGLRPRSSTRWRRSGSSASPMCSTRPRAPLAARFGEEFVRRLDQALGREDEPITPRLPVPAALAEQRFPDPIALEADVLGTIEHLARELGARAGAARRGRAAVCRSRCSAPTARCIASSSAPARRCAIPRACAVCSPTGSPCWATPAIRASAST